MNMIQEKIKDRLNEYGDYTIDTNVEFYISKINEKILATIENTPCNELEIQTNIKVSIPVITDDIGNEIEILKKICEGLSKSGIHICRSSFYDSVFHFTFWVCEFTGKDKKFIQAYEYYKDNFILNMGSIFLPYVVWFLLAVFLKFNLWLSLTSFIIITMSYLILYRFISIKAENKIRRILEEKRR